MVAAEVYLKIAGVSVRLKSRFPVRLSPISELNRSYLHFVSKKPFKNPDIDLRVEVAEKAPVHKNKTVLFQTKRDLKESRIGSVDPDGQGRVVVWEMCQARGRYVLSGGPTGRTEYSVALRPDFKSGTAFVIPGRSYVNQWHLTHATHGFLQVLLIHYLAYHKKGVILHASGIKDGSNGYLFFGPTQSGKSTMAGIWRRHTRAVILNDDRIAVTKDQGRFFIHGMPWNGDFREYTPRQAGSSKLRLAFFLGGHAGRNYARAIAGTELFQALFPQTMSVFWDKACADFVGGFLSELACGVEGFDLTFADNEEIIGYVRSLGREGRCSRPALRF